jgi:hypothetical protein
MRKVTDYRHKLVVPLRIKHDNFRAEFCHYSSDLFKIAVRNTYRWRQYPNGTFKQFGVCSSQTDELASGHWVSTDKSWIIDLPNEVSFHSANICHQSSGFGKGSYDLIRNGRNWRRNESDCGVFIYTNLLDDPERKRLALDVFNGVTSSDVPTPARQRETERATDQTKTEDIRSFLRHNC